MGYSLPLYQSGVKGFDWIYMVFIYACATAHFPNASAYSISMMPIRWAG